MITLIGSATLVLAALMSQAPAASFWGRWPRYEGAVMIPVYFAAAWLGARLLGPQTVGRELRHLVDTVAVVSTLLGIVSALEAFGLFGVRRGAAR